jgi:septal ring factor EnvC (AmiA/AmiB activator)
MHEPQGESSTSEGKFVITEDALKQLSVLTEDSKRSLWFVGVGGFLVCMALGYSVSKLSESDQALNLLGQKNTALRSQYAELETKYRSFDQQLQAYSEVSKQYAELKSKQQSLNLQLQQSGNRLNSAIKMLEHLKDGLNQSTEFRSFEQADNIRNQFGEVEEELNAANRLISEAIR